MTSKELVKKAFTCKEVDRIPWVPFIGCHAGQLIGVTASQYLQSAKHIVNGVTKAIEKYNPDGIPVIFDLQIEAEALGCELAWADENPPAVISHPLLDGENISDLKIPGKDSGRIGIVIESTKKLRKNHPEVALYGLITGPFTLALHLLGTDIFIKMFEDPELVNELMTFTSKVSKAMASYYIEAGCDVIALVDPMTSQIDPQLFETFVSPFATDIFNLIRKSGALSSFFVCGHAQQNIEVMCICSPNNISIDENIPLDYVKEVATKYNVSFGGNIKLTVVLLMGTPKDAQINAMECMELGGKKGFILAPGCDMPMMTPPENIEAITQLVHNPYQQNVVRELEKKDSDLELLNMKDYGKTDKVIVDIITLDSESCAPCQYMVEAVKRIAPHFEGIVEWREHAIKKMESVTFMASLMVKNIPTICIDGKIAFVSKIPPKTELIAAIQKRINEKLKLKIREKKGEITILCHKNDDNSLILERIDQAIQEIGKDVKVNIVKDENMISSFGVSITPAIVLTEYKLKSQGDLPSVDAIKEWIKDI